MGSQSSLNLQQAHSQRVLVASTWTTTWPCSWRPVRGEAPLRMTCLIYILCDQMISNALFAHWSSLATWCPATSPGLGPGQTSVANGHHFGVPFPYDPPRGVSLSWANSAIFILKPVDTNHSAAWSSINPLKPFGFCSFPIKTNHSIMVWGCLSHIPWFETSLHPMPRAGYTTRRLTLPTLTLWIEGDIAIPWAVRRDPQQLFKTSCWILIRLNSKKIVFCEHVRVQLSRMNQLWTLAL